MRSERTQSIIKADIAVRCGLEWVNAADPAVQTCRLCIFKRALVCCWLTANQCRQTHAKNANFISSQFKYKIIKLFY